MNEKFRPEFHIVYEGEKYDIFEKINNFIWNITQKNKISSAQWIIKTHLIIKLVMKLGWSCDLIWFGRNLNFLSKITNHIKDVQIASFHFTQFKKTYKNYILDLNKNNRFKKNNKQKKSAFKKRTINFNAAGIIIKIVMLVLLFCNSFFLFLTFLWLNNPPIVILERKLWSKFKVAFLLLF